MRKVFREFTEEKWQQIMTHPYYKSCLESIVEKSEKYLANDPPRIKFSDMHIYFVTGSRQPFMGIFREYQARLVNHVFMYLYTKDEKYITHAENILWNICDFESWSCAYTLKEDGDLTRRSGNLDLTSAEIGCDVAEALYLIGDKLHPLVYRRAKAELQRRIIDAYAKYTDFWWMNCKLNWAGVCTGNIMSAYIYMATDEEIEAQLPRMLKTFEGYLEGFDDDGGCLEGLSYWRYGFNGFCKGASMLRDYTDGKIDLFKNPKVRKIAKFQQNAVINDKQMIPFSDCGFVFNPSPVLSHFLKHEYDDVQIPAMGPPQDCNGALRSLLWTDPELADSVMKPESVTFHGAQWFIHRDDDYNFACKGGHNNEPHNHNDIGSFVISKGGEMTFMDSGVGEYTRQYFEPEHRYDYVVTSSRGHSVPIINGKYQVIGTDKCVVTCDEENEYGFNMECAYGQEELKTLNRHFRCDKDGVTLTDSYSFSEAPESVVERFISLKQPILVDGRVRVGESFLEFDPEVFELSFSSEDARRWSKMEPVYFTDLKVKNPVKEFKVSVRFT